MPKIVIYSKSYCPYCVAAKRLLKSYGLEFEEIDITGNAQSRAEMIQLANGRTSVPQIFINGAPIGGCDDLHALEARGELKKYLEAANKNQA